MAIVYVRQMAIVTKLNIYCNAAAPMEYKIRPRNTSSSSTLGQTENHDYWGE